MSRRIGRADEMSEVPFENDLVPPSNSGIRPDITNSRGVQGFGGLVPSTQPYESGRLVLGGTDFGVRVRRDEALRGQTEAGVVAHEPPPPLLGHHLDMAVQMHTDKSSAPSIGAGTRSSIQLYETGRQARRPINFGFRAQTDEEMRRDYDQLVRQADEFRAPGRRASEETSADEMDTDSSGAEMSTPVPNTQPHGSGRSRVSLATEAQRATALHAHTQSMIARDRSLRDSFQARREASQRMAAQRLETAQIQTTRAEEIRRGMLDALITTAVRATAVPNTRDRESGRRSGGDVDFRASVWRDDTDRALRESNQASMEADQRLAAHRLRISQAVTDEIHTDNIRALSIRGRAFLESLSSLPLQNLPEDNLACDICLEQYRDTQRSDDPVRLPCTHIIGKACLGDWLKSSAQNANNNKCPICRTVLFKRGIDPSIEAQNRRTEEDRRAAEERRRNRTETVFPSAFTEVAGRMGTIRWRPVRGATGDAVTRGPPEPPLLEPSYRRRRGAGPRPHPDDVNWNLNVSADQDHGESL